MKQTDSRERGPGSANRWPQRAVNLKRRADPVLLLRVRPRMLRPFNASHGFDPGPLCPG